MAEGLIYGRDNIIIENTVYQGLQICNSTLPPLASAIQSIINCTRYNSSISNLMKSKLLWLEVNTIIIVVGVNDCDITQS